MTTRPTTDKIKESIFSILQMRIPDAGFLDLFAGSGQMGIEALSRGAKRAVLVDESSASASAINHNLMKTKLSDRAAFLKRDVFRALDQLGERGEVFDIIYMDPPYAMAKTFCLKAAESVCRLRLIRPEGLFIVEHSSEDQMPENVMNLTLYRRCKYGATMLTFYTTDVYYSGGILDE